jgi:HEPN domain-containing protein
MAAGPDTWLAEAKEWMASAKVLKKAGHSKQAYCLAGQAVEYALKAVYMRRKSLREWPPEHKGATWHDLTLIADRARLEPDLARLRTTNRPCYESWLTVRAWDSKVRFPGNRPPARDLKELFLAVCHERNGVMAWLEHIFHSS